MIRGFEKQTRPISDAEKEHARYYYQFLKTNSNMYHSSTELRMKHGIASVRLRIIMHYIRIELCKDDFIIANNKGYKYTRNPKEIEEYLKSLSERINSQVSIFNRGKSLLGTLEEK